MTTHEHAHIAERNTLGFWVYLMSDCVLFAGLFATYAVLWHQTFGGPGASDILNLPFVLLETVILLTSSFFAGLSLVAAQRKNKKAVVALLALTLLLGVAFISMELSEFLGLIREGNGPGRSAFLSAFFTLLGTHGLHVLLGSVWLVALMAHIVRGGLREAHVRKLALFSIFWHFLDLIWIFIFTFVYLFAAL